MSVLIHGDATVVASLAGNTAARITESLLVVVLTVNVPETLDVDPPSWPFPVWVIERPTPNGFGASALEFMCVVNLVFRMVHKPFPALLAALPLPDADACGCTTSRQRPSSC